MAINWDRLQDEYDKNSSWDDANSPWYDEDRCYDAEYYWDDEEVEQ